MVTRIITTFITRPLGDYSATWFVKRNNGKTRLNLGMYIDARTASVYEPETRLYIMLFMLVLGSCRICGITTLSIPAAVQA
ncbi:hypothetical protein NEOLEDRAFT_1140591 [Neolentinus lepideus HHB14362 ss-1]|uniref:Uncharacterized protein n=1 Tax=Neolentinus lepideus HHB14362 ss-1 TaxID=1314782 RepID=A0A165P448_9AGAM|nr:hypothetical protein NEOLEDRAFT_1140591 [Neolentinus lepideus HHB14362 ss-1]